MLHNRDDISICLQRESEIHNSTRKFPIGSLLVTALEAYFLGKQHLFKGLAIERLETKWEEYPVLHLDLNAERYNSTENLELVFKLMKVGIAFSAEQRNLDRWIIKGTN